MVYSKHRQCPPPKPVQVSFDGRRPRVHTALNADRMAAHARREGGCAGQAGPDDVRPVLRQPIGLRRPAACPAAIVASRRAAQLLPWAGTESRLNESGSLAGLCLRLARHTQAWIVSEVGLRAPGCGLELAPRTLSPRNRVSIFYISGIHPTTRPAAADQEPGVQPGGTDGKAPGFQARGVRNQMTPGVQAGDRCDAAC